ncbi:integration host factor subunit alpha (plasmid) [Spiroplasma corruscae]|uniref:Integration host factor subunit alpha n=1 Tax=Spiroplasma corruscae TaxID=216934 RepID=A0A222EQK4_9MOLU|nr:HU family DNA-binding protein [Spiroplasma corruscae]ASP28802.1 integration host factor subunit alpha [Spiroplasma corruscae]
MVTKEFIKRLSFKLKVSNAVAKNITEIFLNEIRFNLIKYEKLKLINIGKFELIKKDGAKVVRFKKNNLLEKNYIYNWKIKFKPSRNLLSKVKEIKNER